MDQRIRAFDRGTREQKVYRIMASVDDGEMEIATAHGLDPFATKEHFALRSLLITAGPGEVLRRKFRREAGALYLKGAVFGDHVTQFDSPADTVVELTAIR